MRTTFLVATATVLALVLGGAYLYDRSRENVIAEGIRVGHVDVGGMRAGEARSALQGALLAPLNRAIVVRHGGRDFRLTPRPARIHAHLGGVVASALDRSDRK